uniref:non-specific serine/threonine protein kinase n=3 Tax=Rhodosorus marinus TaxID=101924 RepID=A0A7S3A882_9RHOD|mmetsp:Transcript_5641/g.23915  ORF Transcript_5641/g.23915 Transcript_5641/m.23915 type:complete len:337 (+) Transcript_5641:961-1971(+)
MSNTFRSSDTGERIAKWKQLSRHQAFSAVGTPNYISPEVLMTGRYDETSDWWSLGIIMYEMLIGYPPFWSSSPASTCRKILGWKEYLKFPKDVDISPEAKDLIQRLICAPKDRLGRKKGRAEFEEHAFFKNKIRFDRLSSIRAPFVPELVAADDTRYFDVLSDGSPEDSDPYDDLSSAEMVEKYKRATVRHRFLQRSYGGDFAGYSYMNFTAMGGLESAQAFQAANDIPDEFILMSLSGEAERKEVEDEDEGKDETEHPPRPNALVKLLKKKPKDTKIVNFVPVKGEKAEVKSSPVAIDSTERRPEETLNGLGEAKNLDEVTNGNVPVPVQVQISS